MFRKMNICFLKECYRLFFQMSFFYGSDCGALALIGTKTKFLEKGAGQACFAKRPSAQIFLTEKVVWLSRSVVSNETTASHP
ncbi:hypothetical protein LEP1GSC016_0029 [Leptospira borgpetersenii serovar Hardjo-bovis str. Sponselee]|uniref:Uncharacterized protein n=2 Tax=Leptospira borgpetersenii TaxID=174 RepID=M6BQM5_LEPBO|nr:hypothetical protein LBK6_06015 [Leptospira borgpetersenii serovar Hardjo]AWV69781.1 hypothetical protein B9T54_06545 [Leptospira borgpetersenii serovar Hardjo-bovis]EMJ80871.1 hypothetical protein LEP1GSC016_0029 [Leptospira borgpetersenii serovar Hardjo-bovis str. Sponselee]EMO61989.1 hypothetical protein LEP1GSC133_2520 [Leptospira borgpetersenii serovar Pomona str. 200901868]TQE52884.1 hypothetical protein FFZ95_09055 [Leptospira borgpetersenii]